MEDQGTEDQVTADQVTGEQRTEDTGDDQKSTVENNPAVNDSKPEEYEFAVRGQLPQWRLDPGCLHLCRSFGDRTWLTSGISEMEENR